MNGSAHIVALAARTPVGLRAEASAAAVRAGISRVRAHPFMIDAAGDPLVCGLDRQLAPELLGAERLAPLVDSVIAEVSDKLSGVAADVGEVPCWLALPEPRPGLSRSDLDGVVRQATRCSALQLSWQAVMHGHAGAVLGLERALEALRLGRSRLCLVAGVESYFDADTIDWLDADRRLRRDGIRGGFPPGEGAALLALTSEATRFRLGLRSLAVITSVAHCLESGDESSDEGLLGVGLTEVYASVAARLPAGARFDDVFIDINDERARTTDYAFAALRCGAAFRDASQYITGVGATGELGAASAPFHCVLATHGFARGYAAGPHALVSCASWGGLRGGVLIEAGRS
jgi:3-oxoacyl-[acyl-carrier-protein] synthase-1